MDKGMEREKYPEGGEMEEKEMRKIRKNKDKQTRERRKIENKTNQEKIERMHSSEVPVNPLLDVYISERSKADPIDKHKCHT